MPGSQNTNEVSKYGYQKYRIVLHVAFWSSIVIYDVVIWGLVDGKYVEKFVSTMAELPIKMAAAYFTLYVLIDRYFIQKKYARFLISLVVSMFASGLILRFMGYYFLYPIFYPQGLTIPLLFLPKILIAIFYTYSWVAMLAAVHVVRKFYEHQYQANQLLLTTRQLEKEKLEAELKLLKSQIHPHFLFNTLNNLYALALSQSSKTPVMVHQLSELMSYMLYDSHQQLVELQKEVTHLQHYIALERLRYNELEVTFANYVAAENIKIAPLLLLPFVENCFKHGDKHKNSWIHFELSLNDGNLTFKTENKKPERADEQSRGGIGLDNVKRRLTHEYPQRHDLQIFDTRDTYLVVLQISLNGKREKLRIKN
ncbi:histidine kinase [Chryseolinea sp. T2]|uniref:sensor histidine kinase n=1 Tax=Chryseolinea sp. T2 TaxID=3129255 RepID=UPI003076EA0C